VYGVGTRQNGKILLVDDDKRLHEGIRDYLEPHGYLIRSLYTGLHAVAEVDAFRPNLLLLDVMLPGGKDGFDLLREIRKRSRLPVVMLTARGEESDRIVGLEMGADDYLAKPFSPRELLARIKAVLRRVEGGFTDEVDTLASGSFTLDMKRHSLCRQGKTLPLSTSEARILRVFLNHAGEVLSRDQILSLAFGNDHYAGDRNVDVHVSRLRGLLRGFAADLTPIRTVWGTGYRWVDGA
jgi:two-component system phosphate regulon response regulator OmpR